MKELPSAPKAKELKTTAELGRFLKQVEVLDERTEWLHHLLLNVELLLEEGRIADAKNTVQSIRQNLLIASWEDAAEKSKEQRDKARGSRFDSKSVYAAFDAYVAKYDTKRGAAGAISKTLGMSESTVRNYLRKR